MGKKLFGGSSSANSSPRSPVEDPNSLRSRAVGRVIDVIAEGPCGGLADGYRSIYFDSTPVENKDLSKNFTGMEIHVRVGYPDQEYIPDFPAVESEVAVGTQVKQALPVTRRVDNLSADAIRVTITLPSLVFQDTATGDTKGARVDFVIRIRRAGRTNWDAEYPQVIEGKQTGQYQRQYRIPLPGDGPWDVQVARTSPDSDKVTLQNTIHFSSYTEIIDHKLTYPNTALIATKFHAEQFDNVPKREYDWLGWVVKVPFNYDPVSRFYNGLWDGSFKMAWTDNPAWVMYALLTHPRGANLPESSVDKWGLYQVARYCDEFVDDGYGGKEPRFTANGIINTREEAFAVINTLASTFRGMAYWSAGAVNVIADMPTNPSVVVTPSNTIGGFTYSGVANKARHTACAVAFLDKSNNYERSIEVYEDIDAIEKWGYNLQEVTGFATTSRGQAMRAAKWLVDTEVNSGDSLTYKASLDHLNVVPGAVVEVHDPTILGFRAGGRLKDSNNTVINLDDTVNLVGGVQYRVKVVMPDLSVEERLVTTPPGPTTALTVTPGFPAVPLTGAQWVLLQNNLTNARQFRVLGISEDDGMEYTVAAIEHDPFKYDRIEKGIVFAAPPFSQIPNPGIVSPPTNVRVERQYISTGLSWTTALQVTWDASPDAYVSSYRLAYRRDSGNMQVMPETSSNTFTIYGETAGRFYFQVQAINYAGVLSRPAVLDITILDSSPITLIRPSGLELEGQGNNNVFSGRDPKFHWRPTALRGAYPLGEEPQAGAGYLDHIFRDYEIRIYSTGGKLVHTDHTGLTWWTFAFDKNAATEGGPHRAFKIAVYMRDKWGNVSLPAELDVINPAPPQPVNLQVVAGLGTIFVSHDKPADSDFAGDLIWLGEASGFEPGPANQVVDSSSTYNVVQAPASSVRYLRLASYDVFGKTGLNLSPEFRIDVGGVKEPDSVPPKVPTGLKLSSRAVSAPDGAVTYKLRADWDDSAEDDFLFYKLEIAEDGGNFVFFTSPENTYEWDVQPGARYTVRLSAVDNLSNISLYSFSESITITAENAPKPADPAALLVTGTFRVLWLQWPPHPAKDFDHMEIWEATENDRSKAVHIHNATGTTFPRQGLQAEQARYYWIKAVTRSLAVSEFYPVSPTAGVSGTTGGLLDADFPDGIVKSDFIESLDAVKIQAGSVLSGEILVNGTALGGIAAAALDPGARLVLGETKIEPGAIRISGATTLADWRFGGDVTKINGGNIATNSITANKLIIGLRNIDFVGLSFVPDKKTNTLTWSAGTVHYPADDVPGATRGESIAAGGVTFFGQILYIVWAREWGNLRWTTDPQVNSDPNQVVVGVYYGGSGWIARFGRTVIDGDSIQTGTVHADKIEGNTITAKHVNASEKLIANQIQLGPGTINGQVHIENATIYDGQIKEMKFDKLTGGNLGAQRLQVGGVFGEDRNAIVIEGSSGFHAIRYHDSNGISRVEIGQNGPTPNPEINGLTVRGVDGRELLRANGFGVNIMGSDQLQAASSTNVLHYTGSPSIAFQSSKSYQNIPNRTVWTVKIPPLKGEDANNFHIFRLNINNSIFHQWEFTEEFPPNVVLDIPANNPTFVSIQAFWVFSDGSSGWFNPDTTIPGLGGATMLPKRVWPGITWTILEVKR